MKKEYKINKISEYFEKYASFLDAEYSKGESQKNQRSNKRMTHLGFLLSFVMILLTLFSFAIGSLNSMSSQLSPIDSMCGDYYLSYFNNSNFTQDCFNLTIQRIGLSSTTINTNLKIFDTLKWLFLFITIIILAYLLNDVIIDRKYDKDLEKLNDKIILIRSIILNLHSLESNNPDKLKTKEVQDVLSSFDKTWSKIGDVKSLEFFNNKLINLLNKFLRRENEKRRNIKK